MKIARISISPVKGFRLSHPEEVELGPDGVAENRRFFLVGPDGERLRSSLTPWPVLVRAEYDAGEERLRMEFPRGTEIEGAADALGDPVHSATGSLDVTGRVVEGPWEAPLSELAGHAVRLVRLDRIGAGLNEPVTFVPDGSLDRLARQAETTVDSRRFRMLFELSGCEAHEEDTWAGQEFAIGEAVVRVYEASVRAEPENPNYRSWLGYTLGEAGDHAGARNAQWRLNPVRLSLTLGTAPGGVKAALALLGLPIGPCRDIGKGISS